MGLLGERLSSRDVAIGMVLSLSLGFGLLFLHFYTAFATQATALLFGNVLGVDRGDDRGRCRCSASSRSPALAAIMRPLLFASLQPELAEAQGRAAALRLDRCSWPSWRSPWRNARRSSACCWCSR